MIDRFDFAAGAWAFYSLHHEGQGSDFYRRLCLVTRQFDPGPMLRESDIAFDDSEWPGAHMVYVALCDKHETWE